MVKTSFSDANILNILFLEGHYYLDSMYSDCEILLVNLFVRFAASSNWWIIYSLQIFRGMIFSTDNEVVVEAGEVLILVVKSILFQHTCHVLPKSFNDFLIQRILIFRQQNYIR